MIRIMSRIEIDHLHALPPDRARAVLEGIAQDLCQRYALAARWDAAALRFAGKGVTGTLTLAQDRLRLSADLGFPLSLMHAPIEREIREQIRQRFGGSG